MGMELTVTFTGGTVPSWQKVHAVLESKGIPAQVRMIDNELAFPDEVPPETWRELRLGAAPGMVTLRRESDRVSFVIWGNAEQQLLQMRNGLVWAFAEAGGGRIVTAEGSVSSAEFQRGSDLPAGFHAAGERGSE